jgi:hypothetical protein
MFIVVKAPRMIQLSSHAQTEHSRFSSDYKMLTAQYGGTGDSRN